MKKETQEVESKTKLSTISIFCSVLNKEVIATDYSFTSNESECDLCGSHGEINLYVKCDCGKSHDIKLRSW